MVGGRPIQKPDGEASRRPEIVKPAPAATLGASPTFTMLTRRDYDLRSRELTGDQLRVYRALRWGQAITAAGLGFELGFERREGSPDLRSVISELVELGFPIVSSSRGFWLTESREEIERYVDSLQGRADGIETRIRWMRRIAEVGERRDPEFVQATMFGE